MATALLSYKNIADDATLSAPSGTSTESGLGVDNLKKRRLVDVVRFTSDDDEQVKANFGSKKTFSLVVVIGHNMTSSAKWQLETSDDDFSTTKTDTGKIDVWPISDTDVQQTIALYQFSSDENSQYLRITFDDTSNSDGYIEAGRLIVDDPYEPDINPNFGFSFSFVDPSNRRFTRSGSAFTDVKTKRRLFSFDLESVGNTAESDAFNNDFEIERQLGKVGDLFFSLDPTDNTKKFYHQSMYCVLSSPSPLEYSTPSKLVKSYEIEEVR